MANFQDYINVINSGIIRPRIKIEWLRVDETVESIFTSDILDGSLTINRNNGVRRAIDFTVKNVPELLPSIYGIWINKKIRLSLGVVCADGTDYFLPQGVFVLSDPSYISSPSGGTISFSAVDKFSLLNSESGGILLDIYQINTGTVVGTSVQTILTTFTDPTPANIQPITTTFPYTVIKQAGDNAGKLLQDIAYFCSRNVYYNELGQLMFVDDIADDLKGSLWDFNTSDDRYNYLGSTINYEFSKCRNTVKVIGDNPNGTPVSAIAQDTDLTSPTNIYAIGVKPADVVYNSILSTTQQCQNLANYMLKRLKVINQSISITSRPMYHLDVDSIITLTDSLHNLDRSRFLVNSITIPLGITGGDMSINAVSADEVDFFTGKLG